MYIHTDIFSASHKRVFLSGGVEPNTQNLLQKGCPLHCVALPDISNHVDPVKHYFEQASPFFPERVFSFVFSFSVCSALTTTARS
jgi:hypothetical protein